MNKPLAVSKDSPSVNVVSTIAEKGLATKRHKKSQRTLRVFSRLFVANNLSDRYWKLAAQCLQSQPIHSVQRRIGPHEDQMRQGDCGVP
jgi:hypothetical protein